MKTFNPDLRADLTAIGGIYTLIILIAWWFISSVQTSHQLAQLQSDLLFAKTIAVELDQTNASLHNSLKSMNQAYDEQSLLLEDVQKLIQIRNELRNYSLEEQALGLALNWTESTWNPDVDHNSSAEGQCGVVPKHWADYLASKNIDVNSAAACIEIYNFYKDKHNGSRTLAIKDYKGIKSKSNMYLVDKTLYLKSKILKLLK